jgi:hypothetical protein
MEREDCDDKRNKDVRDRDEDERNGNRERDDGSEWRLL